MGIHPVAFGPGTVGVKHLGTSMNSALKGDLAYKAVPVWGGGIAGVKKVRQLSENGH